MSRKTLSDYLRHYYEEKELPAETRERLARLAGARADAWPDRPGGASRSRPPALVAAAVAASVVLALVGIQLLRAPSAQGDALAAAIAAEIALNHSKNLAVEFPAKGYAELRDQMEELDFTLHPPSLPGARGLRVVGGRYCSIQGQLAAQIKLEDDAGRLVTLYETRFVRGFAGLSEGDLDLQGLRIRIWRDGDLLLGLARSDG
jgi:anti-sigma factor RsiW